MAEFTSYPRQDSFETTLSSDIDASVTTIGLNLAPSFALTSGTVYAVIDYDKPDTKIEILSFSGISAKNLTGCTRGVAKYEGGASTAQTHASGAKVIISDNWQTWKDISTAISTKLNTTGGTITGGLTITGATQINNTLGVTGAVTLTTDLAVTEGGTGASNAVTARANLGAAASGANSDITSLTSLSTPLSVAQGGTGANAHTAKNILIGNGTAAFTELAPGAASQIVTSNGTDWVAANPPTVGVAAKLLSNTNTTDGNNDDVARGSIIVGNSTPKWDALPIGAAGTALISDGTDVSWGKLGYTPSHFFYGHPFADSGSIMASLHVFLQNDGLKMSFAQSNNVKTFTRLNTSAWWSPLGVDTATTCDAAPLAHYVESGTNYLIGKKASVQTFRRMLFSGASGVDCTITGTAPTTIGIIAFDKTNNYLLVREGTTTTIRRYSVAGTVLTNINSNITLSSNPVGPQTMWVSGSYIYIVDVDTNVYIKCYNMSGTLISTSSAISIASANSAIHLTDYNTGEVFVFPCMSGAVWSNAGYKLTLPV